MEFRSKSSETLEVVEVPSRWDENLLENQGTPSNSCSSLHVFNFPPAERLAKKELKPVTSGRSPGPYGPSRRMFRQLISI